MKYLIILLMWTGYCALHSYLISITFTKFMSRLLKTYYVFYRLFYVLISLILLVPLINYTKHLSNNVIITYGPFLTFTRYILISGSVLITVWAFFLNYDPLSFFGIRQLLNRRGINKPTLSKVLKKNGLLGIVRHPMYLALIIFLWSNTFTLTDIMVNVLLTIYVIIGTRLEEKKLVLEFGNSYTRYQQEVPMIIPFTKNKQH